MTDTGAGLDAAREALEASTDGTNYATLHPDHVAAILYALDHHAAALSAARAEGAREAFERAAKACDSYVGDSDGSAFSDGVSIGRDQCAAAIRALAEQEGK